MITSLTQVSVLPICSDSVCYIMDSRVENRDWKRAIAPIDNILCVGILFELMRVTCSQKQTVLIDSMERALKGFSRSLLAIWRHFPGVHAI